MALPGLGQLVGIGLGVAGLLQGSGPSHKQPRKGFVNARLAHAAGRDILYAKKFRDLIKDNARAQYDRLAGLSDFNLEGESAREESQGYSASGQSSGLDDGNTRR